jgi:hypothetical protein
MGVCGSSDWSSDVCSSDLDFNPMTGAGTIEVWMPVR